MHHVVLDRWSRGASAMHRRDPRVKIIALIVFLLVLATSRHALAFLALGLFALLCAALLWARIPLASALTRAGIVLPFTLAFAGVTWIAGDPARATALVIKSYLSALAMLIVVATTPLPVLLRGAEMLGAPHFLVMVAQFLYRYLFVLSEEAQHMRKAAASRGGSFRSAAGAIAVLFARSYRQAADIHNAMLARGFQGHFRPLATPHFHAADVAFLILASAAPVILRAAMERIA